MSIYKRKKVWWIDIRTPSGGRIRQSTGTENKKLAQQYHDKIKHETWQVEQLEKQPEHLFDEALIMFLKDGESGRDFDTKRRHALYFRAIFGGRLISSLTNQEIIQSIPTRKADTGEQLSGATQNRYRSSLMRILSLAYKAGWLNKLPYIPRKAEAKVRVRWITKEQAQELISNLQLGWMRHVCSFALLTGARMSEILSLTWDNVDFERRLAVVASDKAKSGKSRALPLNDQALHLLLELFSTSTGFVFTRGNGKRILDIDRRDFSQALTESNIKDFHFHDLRHTWASWHVQAGTPLFTLKELGGWETIEMVKKYAHLNAAHLLDHQKQVTFWTHGTSEKSDKHKSQFITH